MHIRLGTRGSALALAQSGHMADALRQLGHVVELVVITTLGDTSTAPLETLGGTGVFATAIRRALLAEECDIAVHSLKDLPTAAYPGLTLAAVPVRASAWDALCARDGLTLATLPLGATVGTGSPRRRAQLAALRPDLQLTAIRGNVATRLRMVSDGVLDAVVLAEAGLQRLGLLQAITQTFGPPDLLPAPGQGALAIECRAADAQLIEALQPLDDPATRLCVSAERHVLATLEAGCSAPVGAWASIDGDQLSLLVRVADQLVRERRETATATSVEQASALGARVAERLLAEMTLRGLN
ncbi:MAG: hydroxymethylbilane synthase, partial [Micropruina sp.]